MLRPADDAVAATRSTLPVRPRRTRPLRGWLAGVTAGLLLTLTACSGQPGAGSPETTEPTSPTASPSTPVPVKPIRASALPLATDLRPANIEDPYTARALGLLLRGLKRYDTKGKAVDEMAQAIETADNKTFTIRLQPGWTFGDGEPVTASSYVDAWNYAARADSGQYRAQDFAPILGFATVRRPSSDPTSADTLAGLQVIDENTFQVTLNQPQPDFPDALGQLSFAPLPKAALTDPAAWSRNPVGNGPYRLEGTWPQTSDAAAVVPLRPNPAYRGGQAPQNDGIDLKVYPTASAALDDLRAGNLDVLDLIPVSDLPKYRTEFGGRAVNQPVGVAQSLVFPVHREPWTGQRGVHLREAISASIDRATIASGLLAGAALPATDLSAPVVEGYSTDACGQWCNRDQTLAAESARAAGAWEGPLTIAYAADHDEGPVATEVCREVTQALGVPCEPRTYPTLRALREAVALGDEQGPYLQSWQMTRPTLSAFLVPRFSTGSPDNTSGFSDPLVDTRFLVAATASVGAQPAAFSQAQPLIFATMPVVPLWSRNAVGATGTEVTGVRTDVFGAVDYAAITRP
ncbi:oligopeptide transport system substrate-binding protein [Kineosphaera limosa]|uniref:Putative ABC transporter substrate-binding protein n=1 Tax=Kineosphaera limosa NBRC 100340 TaxID=1184609 RepID=K6XC29_9MICO|nr:ABC transporter substrate-binding protein [Kineosphaera limosa]NYD99180.1 oligopeptide transport system substrate-binding protein [Kineosphaera limosa]GAB96344.1 putative ABC transporter substrate-binding protein [Kineosphaera limosa NBRC 100340]